MDKISIICVTLNDRLGIEKTLYSLWLQGYSSTSQVIVIDGGQSPRPTASLIREFEALTYIKEDDHGIYNAMNKGIKYSTGSYLWFLNGGDVACIAFERLASYLDRFSPAIMYGDTLKGGTVVSPYALKTSVGMPVCHQSLLVSRKVIVDYDICYDESLSVVADWDWLLRVLSVVKSCDVQRVEDSLSKVDAGGVSGSISWQIIFERMIIRRKHNKLKALVVLDILKYAKLLSRKSIHLLVRLGKR